MNTQSISLPISEIKQKLIQAKAINLLILSNFENDAPISELYVSAALIAISNLIDESCNQLNQGAANEL